MLTGGRRTAGRVVVVVLLLLLLPPSRLEPPPTTCWATDDGRRASRLDSLGTPGVATVAVRSPITQGVVASHCRTRTPTFKGHQPDGCSSRPRLRPGIASPAELLPVSRRTRRTSGREGVSPQLPSDYLLLLFFVCTFAWLNITGAIF